MDVFAEVTFFSEDGNALFTKIIGPLEGDDLSVDVEGETTYRLTNPGILYHFNFFEINEEDPITKCESDYAFRIEFFETPKEKEPREAIGHIEASISKSSPAAMKHEFIRIDVRSKEQRNRGNFRKYADQKLGARFLAAFEDIAKRGGIQTLELVAVPGVNTFYEKYGYVRMGKTTKAANGGNMHSMTKSIKRKRSKQTRRRKSRRNKQ